MILIKKQSSNSIDFYFESIPNSSQVKITFFAYPLKEDLHSDSFRIIPYDEYVEDISLGKKSAYKKIVFPGKNIFALIVVIFITLLIFILNRASLTSIEAIASIFASYIVAKELWEDVDTFLQNVTDRFFISWRPDEFIYRKEDLGAIQDLMQYARNLRHKGGIILPVKFDYSKQSNSKNVELLYKDLTNDRFLMFKLIFEKPVNLTRDLVLGFRISTSRKLFFINFNKEQFQMVENNKIGSVDREKKYIKGSYIERITINIGRMKLYLRSRIKEGEVIKIISSK